MEKKIVLSIIAASCLLAQDIGTIEVQESFDTKVVGAINTKEVKNADLAEALAKKSPSVSLIRRSGIANDIVLRGQKRDNIRVTIDDAVINGACPNRMDPPTSHVLTNMVKSVEIQEGPFDVSEFGQLSGGIKVHTIKPSEELSGEIGATIGSYGYKKGSLTINGGNDKVQGLISYSGEEGDQYKDGDGNTLAEQTFNAAPTATTRYATPYQNIKAYEKKSIMGKLNINLADNQTLALGVTANRSDNVLYPSSKMDARYDDSNLYTLKYTALNLAEFSKKLEVQVYKTDVDHPMDTRFRVSGATTYMTNQLTTDTMGTKIINSFDALDMQWSLGLDMSKRNWDGRYYSINRATGAQTDLGKSINDTDTKNSAIFLQSTKQLNKNLQLDVNFRYDNTKITNGGALQDNDYNTLGGNIVATYSPSESTKYFVALGQASRVPDARELYNLGKLTGGVQTLTGTPNLDETTNREIDLGVQHSYAAGEVKGKVFYSDLKDYIYYRKTGAVTNKFENIDATIYGFELSGAYYINDQFTLDAAYAWKKGQKDTQPTGQSDKDLADITPPKLTLGLTYDYDASTFATAEFVHVDKWSNYDADNGEQELGSYNIVNLKGQTTFAKNFELTLGVDNLFDKTYAISNTYADLTLLTDGTTSEVLLLNEPGRYFYASLKYKF